MADTTQTSDFLTEVGEKPKLHGLLNVLTILTFIACAWELYSNVKNFLGGEKALQQLEDAQSKLETAPDWAKKMAGPEMMEMARKGIENKIPILIIGLLGTALCLYGAIEMRKLKKQGYFFWLIGEILPIISAAVFIGAVFFKAFTVYFLIFPLIFIILYTTQRKHLKY